MAASSRAQKTKQTDIDAEHRISVLGTYVHMCGALWRYQRYSAEQCTCISLALLKFVHADYRLLCIEGTFQGVYFCQYYLITNRAGNYRYLMNTMLPASLD